MQTVGQLDQVRPGQKPALEVVRPHGYGVLDVRERGAFDHHEGQAKATAILNFLGIGFSFPADGSLPGVDVTFKGLVGFGQGLDDSGSIVTLDAPE